MNRISRWDSTPTAETSSPRRFRTCRRPAAAGVTSMPAAPAVLAAIAAIAAIAVIVLLTSPTMASGAASGAAGARAAAARPLAVATKLGAADKVVRGEAEIHQLRSSLQRPYTLFAYAVPTAAAVPHILAIDAGDQVWFSESGGGFAKNFIDAPPQSRIASLDKNGRLSEWGLPGDGTSPMGMLFDRHGDLWITERLGNRISRLHDGQLTQYAVPTAGAWPTGNALDSHGRVWFSETKGDKIGVVDPATGSVREFPLPASHTMTTGIAVDRQDRVWVAERDIDTIGLLDPATGSITQYRLPTPEAKPCGLAIGADGTVWFSERAGGKIGSITPLGEVKEYAIANRFSGPFFLVADQRGDIWFSELFSGQIGRFDPRTREFEHFDIPGEKTYPAGVALDSKGNVWFAEQSSNKIGVIVRTDLSYIKGGEKGSGPGLRGAPTSVPDPAPHAIVELDVPTPKSLPGIVGVDRHNVVWFTQMGGGWVGPGFPPGPPGSKIGFIKDGIMGELATPTPQSGPTSLALDPCSDDVWFSLRSANKIARVRDQVVTEFAVPVADGQPVGIAVDSDHNVWVALSQANKLARRTPEGEWRILDLPEADAEPKTIYADPWNEVWYAEKTGNHIGHVDKEHWRVERYPLPTKVGWPLSLTADDAGNLWFAEMRADKLAVLDRLTRKITEYPMPNQSAPFKILFDAKHRSMWVSTVFYNAILRFDLDSHKLAGIYKVPAEGAWVGGLDRDADDCIWFSEQFANKVGRLCIEGVSSAAALKAIGPVTAAAAAASGAGRP